MTYQKGAVKSFGSDDGRAWNALTPEQFQLMEDYLNQDWEQLTLNGKTPHIAGMAMAAGTVVSNVHENRKKYKILDYLVNRCNTLQQVYLQDHGLSGKYNSNVTRILLAQHGITDKVTVDNTSSDGTMTPQPPALTNEELKELLSKALNKI